jgi:hypothetical protein
MCEAKPADYYVPFDIAPEPQVQVLTASPTYRLEDALSQLGQDVRAVRRERTTALAQAKTRQGCYRLDAPADPRCMVQVPKELDAHEQCHPLERFAAHYPEHREDEAAYVDPNPQYRIDPVFDHSTDVPYGVPIFDDLTGREVLDYQDLYKLGGRVIGRHEATVSLPWFLTSQFISKRLRCTAAEAKQLSDCWQALNATEAMVLAFIENVKQQGVEVAIGYYVQLANAALDAERVDAEDALEHINQGLAHVLPDHREAAYDATPELMLLLKEGVPSAARIAHDLGISLAAAGDIREALILQDFEDAVSIQQDVQADDDEDEDILDDEQGEDKDADVQGFRSEGWHIMDDLDASPDWLSVQPAQVQVMFKRTERATTLDELKKLGQKVYQLSWTPAQRSAFWALWRVRRDALLQQTQTRIARVRKAVAKIQGASRAVLPQLGARLFAVSKEQPAFYSDEGWAVIWQAYKDAKQRAQAPAKRQPTRQQLLAYYLRERDRLALEANAV